MWGRPGGVRIRQSDSDFNARGNNLAGGSKMGTTPGLLGQAEVPPHEANSKT